nr:hypothetical protein CFP56_18588 [Quercus suber]
MERWPGWHASFCGQITDIGGCKGCKCYLLFITVWSVDCHYDGGGVLRQVSSGEGEVLSSSWNGSPGGAVVQNKAFMIFNELCLIHANATSDERNRRTSHDIDLEDESSKYGSSLYNRRGGPQKLSRCLYCSWHLL